MTSAIERFWKYVAPEPNTGCWLWTGSLLNYGYGAFSPGGRAHRFAYSAFKGPIPEGVFVLHRCDVPSCVNPDHLFLGTRADNVADMMQKGRQPRGSRNGSAKLTPAQVLEIFASTEKQAVLAARYGVVHTAISKIKRGHKWAHLTKANSSPEENERNG